MSDLDRIKIIFTDIDGTLLPMDGKDLAPTAELLGRLIQAGYTVIPCTGRGTGNIPREIWNIPGVPAVITANGALVVEKESGRYLRAARVPGELALQVLDYLRGFQGSVLCYRDGMHYVDSFRPRPEVREGFTSFRYWLEDASLIDLKLWLEKDPSALDKMGFLTFDQELKSVIRAGFAAQPFGNRFLVSSSAPWNMEINMADANKGAAAAWLLDYLGFSRTEMLAAGDNLNDLSMLQLAAVSVAPANAHPEVLAAVTDRTPDCAEDGVENFLKQLL